MKIQMFPFSRYVSHNSRLIKIGKELERRGHEVVFAAEDDPYNLIASSGFKRVLTKEIPKEDFLREVYRLRVTNGKSLDAMIMADCNAISEVRPNVMMTDFHVSGSIVSYITGIPHVSLLNYYFTPFFRRDLGFLNTKFAKIPRFLETFNFPKKYFCYQTAKPFQDFRRKNNLPEKGHWFNHLKGDLNLVADLPLFFHTEIDNSDYQIAGPLFMDERKQLELPYADKQVYLSLGSYSSESLLDKLINLVPKEFQVVLTYNNYSPKRKNVVNLGFFPGISAVEKSDLVICHGGNGTIYQALHCGVPVLALPFDIDQHYNSDALAESGAGLEIFDADKEHVSEAIVSAIYELTENSRYRNRAEFFSEIMKPWNASKIAADLIEAKYA